MNNQENQAVLETTAKYWVKGLKNQGYTLESALADLIDNSLDAKANEVKIFNTMEDKDITRICIQDNGIGMNMDTLNDALNLGSNTFRTLGDLGTFGVGMKSASFALGNMLTVYTKEIYGKVLKGQIDLAEIKRTGELVKTVDVATVEEAGVFDWLLMGEDSGTIIYIEKDITVNKRDFGKKLYRDFGRIYRKFLKAGKFALVVNDEKIEADDFLCDQYLNVEDEFYNTIELVNEALSIKVKDVTTNKMKDLEFTIRVNLLPNFGLEKAEGNKARGITAESSGFSILRNGREISYGETFGIWSKHSKFTRIRGELEFSASVDEFLKVSVHKDSISLNKETEQALRDALKFLKKRMDGTLNPTATSSLSLFARRSMEYAMKKAPKPFTLMSDKQKQVKFNMVSCGKFDAPVSYVTSGDSVIVEFNKDHALYTDLLKDRVRVPNLVSTNEMHLLANEIAMKVVKEKFVDSDAIIDTFKEVHSETLKLILKNLPLDKR